MKIAFIVQNLAHRSDSVGFDCIFQYKILVERYGIGNVRLFANVYELDIHPDINIEPFGDFWNYYEENPDSFVIYHFCDGWDSVDDFLIRKVKNCVVRWHNNTVPWFYVLNALDFASGCLSGFEIINRFARESNARFLVNSDFTGRQLAALDGVPSRIHTVFPASTFLSKERSHADPAKPHTPLNADAIELLFVSRVVPHKGHKHILSTAAAVQRHIKKKVRVTFVGGMEQRLKDYWTGLQDIAADLGVDTVFTGLVSDEELLHLYRSCDVFICLSEHEGFGMPVFEAMRCHVPIVAWGTSALGELLAGHPLMSTEFSIPRFAASVIAALDDKVRSEILPLQQEMLKTYTYDVVVGQLISAIEGINSGTHYEAPITPAVVEVDRYENIRQLVEGIALRIGDSLGAAIPVFTHDAPVNYMSRYDVEAYGKFVELLRQRDNGGRMQGRGSIRELHQRPFFIRAAHRNVLNPDELVNLSVSDLLSFDDEVFVKILYGTVLGRPPEQSTLTGLVWRLRRGESKAKLIEEVICSDEARVFDRRIDGADAFMSPSAQEKPAAIVQEPVHARKGLLGWLRPVSFTTEASPIAVEPAQPGIAASFLDEPWPRLEDVVARLRRYISPYTRRSQSDAFGSIHHVDDLLQLGDEEFVAASYEFLLGRKADQGGQDYWTGRLRSDLDRITFLRELANSPESANRADDLDGLADLLFGTGDVTGVTGSKAGARSLAWVENELGRIVNDLVAEAEALPTIETGVRQEATRRSLLRLAANAIHEAKLFERLGVKALPEVESASGLETLLPDTGFVPIKHIHQILITNDGTVPNVHPAIVQRNIESVKVCHPEAKYKLWGLDDLRSFIARHFSRDVLDAFDTLKAYALKADLGRYCLLYIYGGLYSDLSNLFLSPVRIAEGKKVLCFREHKPLHGAFWMNQNTIIYSAPRQPEIKLAIDLVVENVRRREYGVNSLAPSGPVLFGRIFAALGRSEVYQIGEALNLPVGNGLNRACYVHKDGTLVAVRLQGGGGRPSEIGIKGTNVYGEMWDRREIYSEGQMFFPHDHPSMHHNAALAQADCILIEPHMRGVAVFGPYVDLPIGTYEAIVSFYKNDWDGSFSLDVCCNQGTRILEGADNIILDELGMACLQFSLTLPATGIEVRIKTDGNFRGRFKDLTIRRIGSAASGLTSGHQGLKSHSRPRVHYAYSNEAIKTVCQRDEDGIRIEKNFSGVAIFGPYLGLEAGSYEAIVRFYTDMVEGPVTLDVCYRAGEIVANAITHAQVDELGSVRIPFVLDTSAEDIEVRVITNGAFTGKFRDLTIERHLPAPTEANAKSAPENTAHAIIADRPEPAAWSHQFVVEDPTRGIDSTILMTAESVKAVYGGDKLVFWTPDALRSLIEERLSDDVLSAYDAAQSMEAKLTLGRYCVLYTLGGLYVAPGTILVNPLCVPRDRSIACFRSAEDCAESWAIDSAVLYAQREQPEVADFVEQLIVFLESGPSSPTEIKRFEDALFGQMLAVHYRPESYFGGEVVQLTRGYEKANDCFLSFDGHLVALRS